MSAPLLSIRGLVTEFATPDGIVHAVDRVSYDVRSGETVGVVGESGAGKSVTVMSVLGLLPRPHGRVVAGEAIFEGRDLLGLPPAELREVRGRGIGMVHQDPATALNPVLTVGRQIMEAVSVSGAVRPAAARRRAVDLLEIVGVADPWRRLDQYPHEYSGGMRQRAMIAMAIANDPKLLIADEPTTALDVTVQAQVLEVLAKAKRETDAATLLITHDLGLVAEMADRVVVMYAGRVVEAGEVHRVFAEPRHPYTLGLLSSMPRLVGDPRTLEPIPGAPPSAVTRPPGCPFHPRCRLGAGREICRTVEPPLHELDGGAGEASACHFHAEMPEEHRRAERRTGTPFACGDDP